MRSIVSTAACAAALSWAGASAYATTTQTIYSFTDQTDGGFPQAGLVMDSSGALYGTTTSGGSGHGGTVFKLTPPKKGQSAWTEKTLYQFSNGNDGGVPLAGLLIGPDGALYGTASTGGTGGQGVVFKLTPPASGSKYAFSVLYSFTGGNDGGAPQCTPIMDGAGNLYCTASQGGTGVVGVLFELTPPAGGSGAWTETVLYNFTGNADGGEPVGRLLLGPGGALFGVSAGYGKYNYGNVYRLAPPAKGGDWTLHVIHAFKGGNDGEVPRDGVIAGPDGTLYGTTAGFDNSQGTVFSLTPPSGAVNGWKQTVLHRFTGQGYTGNGPWASPMMDAAGNLFGTTLGVGKSPNGEVWELQPPASGTSHWSLKVLHVFAGTTDGQFSRSTALPDGKGNVFGTSTGVAGQSGFYPGTVWEVSP